MVTLLDRRHTAMMLIVVFAATFMDGLDSSIVSIALPTIADELDVDTATSSWVTITYMLVLAGLLVPFARISAQIGVRKVMAYGLAIFTASSLFCGLCHFVPESISAFPFLIAFRAVQAVGAAMMAAAGPMCCTEHLPPEKLGFGMSVVTIGASVGFALGPVVGGALTEMLGWYWVFFINIPIGIAMTFLMLYSIPASEGAQNRIDLDYKGAVALFTAVILGVLGVEILAYGSMRMLSVALIAIALVILIIFVRIEKNTENPLINISMFESHGFTSIFFCLMLVNAAYMGILYLVPFYGERVLNDDPLKIGMFLLVAAMLTAVVGMPIAKWSDRTGRRWFCVAAGLIITVAFFLYGFWADGMSSEQFLLICVLQGLGWGFVGGPMASRLVEHAGDERDMASSLMNEAYYIGGALGTAAIAMIFTVMSNSEGIDISVLSADVFLDGFIPAAYICAALAAVVMVLSYALKDDD